MRPIVCVLVLALVVAMGCTAAPYAKPGVEQAAVEADYTDCYSLAALAANTPPYPDSPIRAVDQAADTCMTSRGYQYHFFRF